MALRSAPRLFLASVVVILWEGSFGASFHSLRYFSTSISDPTQGQPHFVTLGFVDDQVFVHYDSQSRELQPRVSWMEKVVEDHPQYWERETQIQHAEEEVFGNNLETLRNRYNQSEGLHTLQKMYGCELQRDGSKEGFMQYGYDGRTIFIFDKETLTWVSHDPQAQVTLTEWNIMTVNPKDDLAEAFWIEKNQRYKSYLEETCIEWLERYLSYGNGTLLRTEPPMVTVTGRMEAEDGMETHVCRVDGFYPREIDASWTRDGEIWIQDTFRRFVAPNADGTYNFWLNIRIDREERGRYRCHVEHDGLQHPLDVALKEVGGPAGTSP